METKQGLNIGVKSFIGAIIVIFVLMAVSYGLTFMIPGGTYARLPDGTIDTAAGFTAVEGGLPFWKWVLSPILVLGASGGGTLIAVIAFLLVIGAAHRLGACGRQLPQMVQMERQIPAFKPADRPAAPFRLAVGY